MKEYLYSCSMCGKEFKTRNKITLSDECVENCCAESLDNNMHKNFRIEYGELKEVLYGQVLCEECTNNFDWNSQISWYIYSEKVFKPKDYHLFVIGFCSNCFKPRVMRASNIIKGLNKYGYHLCDSCNRTRQAKENLKYLNGPNSREIHNTVIYKEAARKVALRNL